MGHFIRIAFWIFVLSVCLQANSQPITKRNTHFLSNLKCQPGATFYAPENVKRDCITTALDCVLRELDGTVKKECDDPEGHINDVVEQLNEMIKSWKINHPLTNSSDCSCERWSETPYDDFLNKVDTLIELQNNEKN